MFDIYIENANYRRDVIENSGISYETLYQEQREERPTYHESEVCDMVSESFSTVKGAATLLSANGLFLKYAGPTIKSNYYLVKIAVNQNGAAIKYADRSLLTNPDVAADLILSATYGHPCEDYREVIQDTQCVMAVSRKIVELNPDMFQWVAGHMLRNDSSMVSELSNSRKR